MNRTLRIASDATEADRLDLDEWLALDGNARLAIAEDIRREVYGANERRLSRVLRVAPLPSRAVADYGGVSVPVIGRADLMRAKLAAGRPQDLVDAEVLRTIATRKRPRARR
jgi:hypothetical protein